MANHKRIEVFTKMLQTGLVPLFYHTDTDLVKNIVNACYKGGARIFEFTNRGDFAHEVFAEIQKWCKEACPDMVLGVGSVVDSATASLYIQLGAGFIVSPILNPDMASTCNRRKIAWIPGCGTLSEINKAEELGCEIVKIFPAKEIGGPSFVKSVLAPCPWTNIMPSGGVSPTQENLEQWFGAGVSCVGMGSKLITKEIIAQKDFFALEKAVKKSMDLIMEIKSRI